MMTNQIKNGILKPDNFRIATQNFALLPLAVVFGYTMYLHDTNRLHMFMIPQNRPDSFASIPFLFDRKTVHIRHCDIRRSGNESSGYLDRWAKSGLSNAATPVSPEFFTYAFTPYGVVMK